MLKEPLYVTYTLYKGGGECNRVAESFNFNSENSLHFAKASDYSLSGYEKGHLANAEDFAYDCDKEEMTFHYYNCLPQTARLNKGIWKTWETTVRTLSQSKKLFIIAGGIYGKKIIGDSKIGVPSECYKIVLDSKTKKIIYCLIFKNDNSNKVRSIGLVALKRK